MNYLIKLLSIIIAIIIILIKPLVLIRFGKVPSKFGHLSQNLFVEFHKSKKIKALDLYSVNFNDRDVSNNFLFNLWKKKINIIPIYRGNFFNKIESYCVKFSKDDTHSIPRFKIKDHNMLITYPPIFDCNKIFSQYQKKSILKKYNIPNDAKWICINNRDELFDKLNNDIYLKEHKRKNFSINSYNMMINLAIEKGFYIIRLGVIAEEKIIIENDHIIDLPFSKLRKPEDDIFFISNCYLYFGADSGPWTLAAMLGKNIAFVNFTEIFFLTENLYSLSLPFLPSLALDPLTNKYLKFKHYKKNRIYRSIVNDTFLSPNINFYHHNQNDIKNYFIEILDILNLKKKYDFSTDQELFFNNFTNSSNLAYSKSNDLRVSKIILNNYKELLL